MELETDVVIVGARCAGSSLAMLLARAGRDVVVVDRAGFPSDTLSTHLLLDKGVHFMRQWGLLDDLLAQGVPPIELSRFVFGDWWVDIKGGEQEEGPPRFTCAPRRILLDQLLVEAARNAGANVMEETHLEEVMLDHGRACGIVVRGPDGEQHTIRARVVVGADGLRSAVGRQVGAEVLEMSAKTTCQVFAYWKGVELDHMELGLRPGCAYGAFVTDGDLVLLSVSLPVGQWRQLWQGGEPAYRSTLEEWFPAAAEMVFAGERVSPLKGTNELPNRVNSASGAGWALVGDAAMHKDPVSGLGMSDAFHGASILADQLLPALDGPENEIDESLGRYEEMFSTATRPTFDIACRMASHEFGDMEVPGLVTSFGDAVRAEVVALAESQSDPVAS